MIPKEIDVVIDCINAMPEDERVSLAMELFLPDDELKWRIDERGLVGPCWLVSVVGRGKNVRILSGTCHAFLLRRGVLGALRSAARDAKSEESVARNEPDPARAAQHRHCARVARELLAAVEAAWPEGTP